MKKKIKRRDLKEGFLYNGHFESNFYNVTSIMAGVLLGLLLAILGVWSYIALIVGILFAYYLNYVQNVFATKRVLISKGKLFILSRKEVVVECVIDDLACLRLVTNPYKIINLEFINHEGQTICIDNTSSSFVMKRLTNLLLSFPLLKDKVICSDDHCEIQAKFLYQLDNSLRENGAVIAEDEKVRELKRDGYCFKRGENRAETLWFKDDIIYLANFREIIEQYDFVELFTIQVETTETQDTKLSFLTNNLQTFHVTTGTGLSLVHEMTELLKQYPSLRKSVALKQPDCSQGRLFLNILDKNLSNIS